MLVAGHNYFSILCAQTNSQGLKNQPSISPPVNSRLKVSDLLSYSVYDDHAVWVMRDGRAYAIGNATNGKICGKFSKSLLSKQTEITIKDKEGRRCLFISAVCGTWYTLYLLQTHEGHDHLKLAYSSYNKEVDTPIFLNTDKWNPVALFGGSQTAAAIDQDGIVILITESIFKSPKAEPQMIALPNNERAVSVACLEQSYFILSENGNLYKYFPFPTDEGEPELKIVEELSEMRITQISATAAHCLAVTSDGRVYGRGLNENGRMGVNSQFSKVYTFTQIAELKRYKIIGAYAGCHHSLFMTSDGAIFACGANYNGELLLNEGPTEKDVVLPKKTIVTSDATFCIAGIFLSAVFVGVDPPPNTPNLKFESEFPDFPNPKIDIQLPNDLTSMAESEVDRIILRPLPTYNDKSIDDSLLSSSISAFEARISKEQTTPRTLNQAVISIDMKSSSPDKRASSKGEQKNMSSGSKRSAPVDKSQSQKQSEKGLSDASNTKKQSSAAGKADKSLSASKRAESSDKNKQSEKGEENPLSNILNIGDKLINSNQMSSASNIDDKHASKSNKGDNLSNSMARSISSEKNRPTSKGEEKNMTSAASNSKKTSSAAKKVESEANSQKRTETSDKKKLSDNSATGSKRSLPAEKSQSQASSKDAKQLSSASNTTKQSSTANKPEITEKSRSVPKTIEKTSTPKKTSSSSTKPEQKTIQKRSEPPPKKASTSEEDQKSFSFESYPDKRLQSSSKLSINSELAHLRQQNSEMKELLASKDKEILRLTKLNETFIGNNRELQSNLGECWENQRHKIDKLDTLNNSKRRK